MLYDLPKTVEVHGREWAIRSDFRDILNIIAAFDDPNLEAQEKAYVCLKVFYENFEDIPEADYNSAFQAAMDFIDYGKDENKPGRKTMDWEQDAPLLFPAVNHVAGYEVRSVEYLHWWSFMGMFMEIQDGVYATVLSLRNKKANHKKLEKWENEWWQKNLGICKIKPRYSDAEKAEQERIKAMLGG